MNVSKCKIKIYEEEFEIVVNVRSMVNVEEKTGKGFIEVVKGAESGSVSSIVNLLTSCLTKNGELVKEEYILNLEVEVFQELFDPLIECIIQAFPASSDKKKVEVLTMTKR